MCRKKSDPVELDNDIIAMTGYWEPRAFNKRGGSGYVGIDDVEYPYSEEMARKLSDIGISLVIWHYYKGFGIKAEEEEMQRTAEFFKHCEKYGITKGVYINAGSVFADTFIAENPEFEAMIAHDHYGQKHTYSEYYRNYYRWRPCSSNKEFGEYFGRAAVKAIKDAGAEFIAFDNCAQMPCYCEKCQAGFVKYILEKNPIQPQPGKLSFKQRFGHDFTGTFQLPRGTARMPIDNMPGARDPGLYEWIRYRQHLYEETMRTACDMIRKALPTAKIEWNLALDYGEFYGLVWGLDPETSYICKTTSFFSEDSNEAGLEDGRLISHIRTFKYGSAMDNSVFTHNHMIGDDKKAWLNLAEAAAFNGGVLGHTTWATTEHNIFEHESYGKSLDVLKTSLKFLRKHKDVYIKTKCISRAVVYRCSESEIANWADAAICRFAIEQVLIKNNIQYDHIIGPRFDDVSNYDLLICANTITVPDAIIGKIADFVRNGGKLLCTELSFATNEHNQKRIPGRSIMGLAGERDTTVGRTLGRADSSEILGYLGLEDKYAENIFYLPELKYVKHLDWTPCSAYLPIIGKEYFAEPLNKKEVLGLLEDALGEFDVKLDAPENVIAGYFRCPDGSGVVHVLDHELRDQLKGVKVKFKVDGKKPAVAKFVTMESEDEVKLVYDGDYANCVLPAFKIYGFLKI